jgi:uncharacterized protein (TIGR00299 family) protein
MTGGGQGGRLAWFDCSAGIAGDMALGALLDAGGDADLLRNDLARLGLGPWRLEVSTTTRGGLGATRALVVADEDQPQRPWGTLRGLLEGADLPERPRALALAIFERLARAEARVHRVPVERVQFHEVGAVDAVVDVVGAALLLDQLGIWRVTASPVALGAGTVRGGHGRLPVPSPAVLELLKGAPVLGGGVEAELTTPTGAAILAATVTAAGSSGAPAAGSSGFGELPPMRVEAVGYGAGARDLPTLPNVLRVVVGEPRDGPADQAADQAALLLEANVDDMSPELVPWAIERLLDAGAADAWATPVVMKKGRPALTLSVLCPPGVEAAVRAVLWRETTTLGVRRLPVRKWVLDRELVEVQVAGGRVRVKLGRDRGEVVNAAPEFEDCAAVARASGRPLKQVMAEAQARALGYR